MAARPRKSPDSPALEVRRFSTEDAGQAIKRLETRIAEVTALGDQAVRHDDEKARAAERRIRSTILEIFGERSPEYRDHQYHDISGGMSVVVGGFGDEPDAHEPELQENFVAGIRRTVTMLGSLIDTIEERTDHALIP